MRILVVGLGNAGKRHIQNILKILPEASIYVLRHQKNDLDAEDADLRVERVLNNLAHVRRYEPHAAIITNPSSQHMEPALFCAQQGMHLFVEKPISDSLSGVNELIELCREQRLTLMVGYCLRFLTTLQWIQKSILEGKIGKVLMIRAEVGKYLPDWRPKLSAFQSVSAHKSLGGGALLELSHEIDYVRWLVGEVKTVSAWLARFTDIVNDVEDTAEVTLEFENGALGSVHMDMIQRPAVRQCKVVGSTGVLQWEGPGTNARCYDAKTRRWSELEGVSDEDIYLTEMRAFLDCVQQGSEPLVTGEDGRRVLEIVLAARRSAELGERIVL